MAIVSECWVCFSAPGKCERSAGAEEDVGEARMDSATVRIDHDAQTSDTDFCYMVIHSWAFHEGLKRPELLFAQCATEEKSMRSSAPEH